ncbi:hypothetical protein SBV1_2630005 [Verrucomicrobia bacterium]|nr:hypothetical protein SBV1_2630005 [Verrucomicrobiota bacterium]
MFQRLFSNPSLCHYRLEALDDFPQDLRVLDLAAFQNLALRGGFLIAEVRLTSQFLLDPLGRPAAAQTIIRGSRFHIFLRSDLNEAELSISLYHEVLEAATVAGDQPPESVLEFNERDFERAARSAHTRLGAASAEHLNQMLAEFGFQD